MYLLIITNRASNIVEDLDTLRLLSKVVPNVTGTAGNLTEDKVVDKAFDLIFAFDEVITTGGHRENVTLQQIRTNMEMESHEEKLHNMIKMSKMESARDQAAAAAKSIKEKQKMVGLSSADAALMHSHNTYSSNLNSTSSLGNTNNTSSSSSLAMPSSSSISPAPASRGVKGMSLGGAKSKTFEDALIKEDKLAPIAVSASAAKSSTTSAEAVAVNAVVQKPLMLAVAEKVSAKISKDGNVESCEVRGSLTLTAQSEEISNCIIKLRSLPVAVTQAFSFNTHPKINKALYERQNILQLKDSGAGKGFPSGRPVGILKWTSTGRAEDIAPIKINCWPEEEGRGQMSVSIDFSAELKYVKSLHNVQIRIPLGTSASPNIVRIDGQSKHLTSTGELLWTLDFVDSSSFSSAALEFSIAQRDENAFFPIAVSFSSEELFCQMDVLDIVSVASNEPVDYGISSQLSAEEYIIG
jgi:hypothetical protein